MGLYIFTVLGKYELHRAVSGWIGLRERIKAVGGARAVLGLDNSLQSSCSSRVDIRRASLSISTKLLVNSFLRAAGGSLIIFIAEISAGTFSFILACGRMHQSHWQGSCHLAAGSTREMGQLASKVYLGVGARVKAKQLRVKTDATKKCACKNATQIRKRRAAHFGL